MTTRRQFGRIRKLPSGRWQARYPDGSGRDIAGPITFSTKGDAARFLAQMQADLDRGQWRDPRLGQVTFEAWVQEWLNSNSAKRATTRARDEAVLCRHFLPALGQRELAKFTPVHVRGVVDTMAATLSADTVRTNVGVPRAVLNAAVEADLIARSPVRGLRLAKPMRETVPHSRPSNYSVSPTPSVRATARSC